MASNFQFTGNPKPFVYQPRGLEYFTYLPKLKAQAKGAALKKANSLIFDTTGLDQKDLGEAQRRTQFITSSKEKIVNGLLDGNAVTGAMANNLFKLSQNKKELDKEINVATQNAASIIKFNDKWDNIGLTLKDTAYSQKVKDEAANSWQGTFGSEGQLNKFEGYTPPSYAEPTKKADKLLGIAYGNMTPEQRGAITPDSFTEIEMPDGKGGTVKQIAYTGPKDVLRNNPALANVMEHINKMFLPVEPGEGKNISKEQQFLGFMGADYTTATMNEIYALNDAYVRSQEKPSGTTIIDPNKGKGKTTPIRTAQPKKFVADPNILAMRTEVSGVELPEVYQKETVKASNRTGTRVTTQGIAGGTTSEFDSVPTIRDYSKYAVNSQNTNRFLFGDVKSVEDLSEFIVDGIDPDNPNKANKYNNNILSTFTREAIQAGSQGVTDARIFRDAVDKLVDIQQESGEPFDLTLTRQEILHPTAYSKAKLEVVETAIQLYNNGVIDTRDLSKERIYSTEPGYIQTYLTPQGFEKDYDIYQENVKNRVIDNLGDSVITRWEIDEETGTMKNPKSTLKGGDGKTLLAEMSAILQDTHASPDTMSRGLDFGEAMNVPEKDRAAFNRKMSQSFMYKGANEDGSKRYVYAVENTLGGNRRNKYNAVQEVIDGVPQTQGTGDNEKPVIKDSESIVLSMKKGEEREFIMKDSLGIDRQLKVSNEGGVYAFSFKNSDGTWVKDPNVANTKQEVIRVLDRIITPEATQ